MKCFILSVSFRIFLKTNDIFILSFMSTRHAAYRPVFLLVSKVLSCTKDVSKIISFFFYLVI